MSKEIPLISKVHKKRLQELRNKKQYTAEEEKELIELENWDENRSKELLRQENAQDEYDPYQGVIYEDEIGDLKKDLKFFWENFQKLINVKVSEKELKKLKEDRLYLIKELKEKGLTNDEIIPQVIDIFGIDNMKLIQEYDKLNNAKDNLSKWANKKNKNDGEVEEIKKEFVLKMFRIEHLLINKVKLGNLQRNIDIIKKENEKDPRLDELYKLKETLLFANDVLQEEIENIRYWLEASTQNNEILKFIGGILNDAKNPKLSVPNETEKERFDNIINSVNRIEKSIKETKDSFEIDDIRANLVKLRSYYDKIKEDIDPSSKDYFEQKSLFARSIELCNMAIICFEKKIDFSDCKNSYYQALESGKVEDRFKYFAEVASKKASKFEIKEGVNFAKKCEAFSEADYIFKLKFLTDRDDFKYDYENIESLVKIAEDYQANSTVNLQLSWKIGGRLFDIFKKKYKGKDNKNKATPEFLDLGVRLLNVLIRIAEDISLQNDYKAVINKLKNDGNKYFKSEMSKIDETIESSDDETIIKLLETKRDRLQRFSNRASNEQTIILEGLKEKFSKNEKLFSNYKDSEKMIQDLKNDLKYLNQHIEKRRALKPSPDPKHIDTQKVSNKSSAKGYGGNIK